MVRMIISLLRVVGLSFYADGLQLEKRMDPPVVPIEHPWRPERQGYYAGVSDVDANDFVRVLKELPRFERLAVKTIFSRENISCDLGTFLKIQDDTNTDWQKNAGLIISGQGGSATRAAQQVVQYAGTHAFGELSDTYDSQAARWGHAFDHRQEILASTGTVDYSPWDISPPIRQAVQNNMCVTIVKLHKMISDANETKPWGLKEPWLRIMMPFYTQVFVIKFVHVTRDVRNIHETHDDERYADMVGVAANGLLSRSRIQEALATSANVLATAASDGLVLLRTWQPYEPVNHTYGNQTNIQWTDKFALFAFAWAEIELTLHKKWTSEWPDRYFHLSEKKMRDDAHKRETVTSLAAFLGDHNPREETLMKMLSVYASEEEQTPEDKKHWYLMHAIVMSNTSGLVREAMQTFGYEF